MKIRSVNINNRKKCIEIVTTKGVMAMPFAKLNLKPTQIKQAYVDKELGSLAATYVLDSGKEDSIHIDAFLEYNRDPSHMKELTLYKLTIMALKAIELSHLTKREIARKMQTSPAQLYRLLDTANYKKTIDQMFKLMACLGYEIDCTRRRSVSMAQHV